MRLGGPRDEKGGVEVEEKVGGEDVKKVGVVESPDQPDQCAKKVRFACQFPWRDSVTPVTSSRRKNQAPQRDNQVSEVLKSHDSEVLQRRPRCSPDPVSLMVAEDLVLDRLDPSVRRSLTFKDTVFSVIRPMCKDLTDASLSIVSERISRKLQTQVPDQANLSEDIIWQVANEFGISKLGVLDEKVGYRSPVTKPTGGLTFKNTKAGEVTFTGLCSKRPWVPNDCGQDLCINGKLRKNSCVLLAVSRSAGVDLTILFNQVRQAASDCLQTYCNSGRNKVTSA